MNKKTTIVGVLSILGVSALSLGARAEGQAPPADNNTMATTTLDKNDLEFFEEAAQGGLTEVRLSQLAQKQAVNEDVRAFAQRMIDDHTKLNTQLTQLAQRRRGVTVPHALDRKHQDNVDKIAKETGDKLDRSYVSRMVDDHENLVKAFQKQAKDGKDEELKQLAASTLPTLQEHLTQARQIKARLEKK